MFKCWQSQMIPSASLSSWLSHNVFYISVPFRKIGLEHCTVWAARLSLPPEIMALVGTTGEDIVSRQCA